MNMPSTSQSYHVFETARGFCGIAWNERGITRFQLITNTAEEAARNLLYRARGAKPETPSDDIAEGINAAQSYFQGERADFSKFKIDLDTQDDLFKRIYTAARCIRWGESTTYGALAKSFGGGPEMARDVGQAMARNPLALIIPCHRILAARGKIGGFSAPGGVATKIMMLELEGIFARPPPPAQHVLDLEIPRA